MRQGKVEAMGYEKQQNLMRNVANLRMRGLVRIKIEDNGDLALAKKALALELPAVSDPPSVSRHAPAVGLSMQGWVAGGSGWHCSRGDVVAAVTGGHAAGAWRC